MSEDRDAATACLRRHERGGPRCSHAECAEVGPSTDPAVYLGILRDLRERITISEGLDPRELGSFLAVEEWIAHLDRAQDDGEGDRPAITHFHVGSSSSRRGRGHRADPPSGEGEAYIRHGGY